MNYREEIETIYLVNYRAHKKRLEQDISPRARKFHENQVRAIERINISTDNGNTTGFQPLDKSTILDSSRNKTGL